MGSEFKSPGCPVYKDAIRLDSYSGASANELFPENPHQSEFLFLDDTAHVHIHLRAIRDIHN